MAGWAQLVSVAKAQRENRMNTVMYTHTTPENMSEINFIRGEAAGIELFMKLPQMVIDQSENDLKKENGLSDGDDD